MKGKNNKKSVNRNLAIAIAATVLFLILIIIGFGLGRYIFKIKNEARLYFYEYRIAESEILVSPETEYTGEEVTVTITTEKPGLSIQYHLAGDTNWINYTGPFSVKENTTVTARLVAEQFEGPETEKGIKNIAVAKIGDVTYKTLADAINACYEDSGDSKTTIQMLANSAENVVVPNGKNIVLDLCRKNFN